MAALINVTMGQWLIERGTVAGYFGESGISAIIYVVANWNLWIRQNEIEGVFSSHASRYFNGSLWTLFLEASCYVLVPFVAYAGGLRNKRWLVLAGWGALCFLFLIDLFQVQPFGTPLRMFSLMKVGIYFATGVLCYAWSLHLLRC